MTTRAAPTRRRATSYDVARSVGVAQSTVSRCFQDDSNISQATKDLVRDAALRLGYTPNALARSLITQRSNMIAVIVTRYTLRGNPDVIYAVGEALAASGKQLLLVPVEHDAPTIADLRVTLEYPLDGLISCVQIADIDLADIQVRGIPMVLFNRRSAGIPVDSVATRHFDAAGDIAARLHGAGHRRFLCMTGPADAPVSAARRDGFLGKLQELGVHDVQIIETDYSYDGGKAGFLAGLAPTALPDAVFCTNDQIAFGVMDAARFTLGLRIPDNVSVVGFDDVPEAGRPGYNLTTMQQDSVQMARLAVQLLLRRITAPEIAVENLQIAARFVARGSAQLAAK